MIALIYGSRTWDDEAAVHEVLEALLDLSLSDLTVMHGDCPTGADNIAKWFCKTWEIPMDENPADWDQHKKKAGRIRNTLMRDKLVSSAVPFVAVGFRNDGKSYGTDMMTELLLEVGIEPTIVHPRTEVIHE